MASFQDQINIIKDVLMTHNKDTIVKTISSIHPVILMYYQMMDNTFEYYNDKLSEEYFKLDIDDTIKMLIDIGDVNFVNYIIKELNYNKCCFENQELYNKGIKIIESMIEHYFETEDIYNLNIIHENTNWANTMSYVIHYSIIKNKPALLEMFLMNPKNNNIKDAEPDDFKSVQCSHIMYTGDLVEIVRVFHEYSKKYPDFIDFDFNLVFNAALVNGRYKCMQYALENGTINYHYEKEDNKLLTVNGIYPFTDSIMYAIIGKNIKCIQTVIDMFSNKINCINKWEEYFKFASVYGTIDIIKYMLTLKPYSPEQIEGFYNKILKFALCQANINIVKFAISNGASFNEEMNTFVKDYNHGRGPEEAIDDDYIDFYMVKYTLPDDFKKKYIECIKFINNY